MYVIISSYKRVHGRPEIDKKKNNKNKNTLAAEDR